MSHAELSACVVTGGCGFNAATAASWAKLCITRPSTAEAATEGDACFANHCNSAGTTRLAMRLVIQITIDWASSNSPTIRMRSSLATYSVDRRLNLAAMIALSYFTAACTSHCSRNVRSKRPLWSVPDSAGDTVELDQIAVVHRLRLGRAEARWAESSERHARQNPAFSMRPDGRADLCRAAGRPEAAGAALHGVSAIEGLAVADRGRDPRGSAATPAGHARRLPACEPARYCSRGARVARAPSLPTRDRARAVATWPSCSSTRLCTGTPPVFSQPCILA